MNEILKNTQSFFSRLRSHERETFRRFLELHEDGSMTQSKSLKLFDVLNANKEYTDQEIFRKLYGNEKVEPRTFTKLVERFREKMYESNYLDVNLYREDVNSPYFMGLMEAKKLIGLSYNIAARGVGNKEMIRLLKRGISLSEKFELYDEWICFLNLKFLLNATLFPENNPAELLTEMKSIQVKKNTLNEAQYFVYKFVRAMQDQSSLRKDIRDDLRDAIEKLEGENKESFSWNVYYNLSLLKLQFYHSEEQFDEAETLLLALINHLNNQPSLKQFTRIAEAYTNLAATQMFNYKYLDAVKSNEEALRFPGLRPTDKNYYKESLAFLHIYLGHYSKSNQALKEIIAEGLIGNTEEELSRRKYLLATTLFLQGEYKKSNFLLQDTKEIENEKEGWNIGIRLLQIFLTLETEKIDLADQRIESLRKHIERTSKMKSIRKRDVVIFRILRSLAMNGFDFKETWTDRKKDFLLLQSDNPDYRWIPRSHEIILFHQWFESKVKHKNYHPDFTKKVN
ncbi:MAG: hypothetical protein ACKOX3_04595 [Bacteroidota bacterium]